MNLAAQADEVPEDELQDDRLRPTTTLQAAIAAAHGRADAMIVSLCSSPSQEAQHGTPGDPDRGSSTAHCSHRPLLENRPVFTH
jgi:hypothetical protein